MTCNKLLSLPSKFFIGCNYWASHAGTAMWSNWRPEQVDLDLQRLSAAGVEVMRVFPLWPDFQPICAVYSSEGTHFGYRKGEERLGTDAAGRAGMSPVMMGRFAEFVALADKHNIKLIVGLITGWMSGRLFAPPGLLGKNLLTDPDAIRWQVRFVSYFVKTMKQHSTIIAWDLGNECNVMGKVTSQEQAYLWTASISNAIKAGDASRPVLSGMHSLLPKGPWTMQDQGELTDILTTHPYPFWTHYTDFDALDSMCPTLHATAESLFYGQLGGKPCFAEEMGTMGPMVSNEAVAAAFARTSTWSQWAHGLAGLLWWCAHDQTQHMHAPYDWVACEGELGLMTEDGRIKPVLAEMVGVKRQIQNMPFELPKRRVDAVCILNSSQDHWATALGAFMLAKQAKFDIDFCFEDQALPDADFYLLPCVTGVYGVGKQLWQALLKKVFEGATLYFSSNDGYMLNFAEVTGLTVQNRSRRASDASVTLHTTAQPTALSLSSEFRLDLLVDRAEVLATEADGNPVLTRATYGQGVVYFCALPVELNLVQIKGVSRQAEQMPLWRLYEAISTGARSTRVVQVENPYIGITEHPLDAQSMVVVLVNHSPAERTVKASLQTGWSVQDVVHGQPLAGMTWTLAANDALVLRLVKLSTS